MNTPKPIWTLGFAIAGVALGSPAIAQIVPTADTTVTPVPTDGAETFEIRGGQTSRDGANLFHGFAEFNLDTGQIADFQTLPDTRNVLTRVHGGSPSAIDGMLQVSGSNANLYFLNPAGIVFGENAQLNLAGDFFATTATGLGFEAGDWEALAAARGSIASSIANLVGSPVTIEFATDDAGSIVNAGTLRLAPGRQFAAIGGEVVNTGTIAAEGGTIALVSVDEAGWFSLSSPGSVLDLTWNPAAIKTQFGDDLMAEASDAPSLIELISGGAARHADRLAVNPDGTVSITGSAAEIAPIAGTTIAAGTLDVSGDRGGTVYVLGDRVASLGATLDASGDYGGGAIAVGGDREGRGALPNTEFTFVDDASRFDAGATLVGNGGEIIIFASDTARISGELSATGGTIGGDGGFIETSGLRSFQIDTVPDISAIAGAGGEWLIDPFDITIVPGGGNTNINDANPFEATADPATLGVDLITTALQSGDVSVSTGVGATNNSIVFNADLDTDGANGRQLTLLATGGIFMNGTVFDSNPASTDALDLVFNSAISGGDGQVQLSAISTGGGDLTVTASAANNAVVVGDAIATDGGTVMLSGTNTGTGRGVWIPGTIDSNGGAISIEGRGAGFRGIDLDGGSLNSNGGAITLRGTGFSGANPGLDLDGTIKAGSGNVLLESDTLDISLPLTGTGTLTIEPETSTPFTLGTGDDLVTATSFVNIGADFASLTIGSTTAGDITIGTTNLINLTSPTTLLTNGNLNLNTLTLNGNPLTISTGSDVTIASGSGFEGNVTIVANDLGIGGPVTIDGDFTIRPNDPTATIGLGFDGGTTSAPGNFILDDVALISHITMPIAADGTRRTLSIGDPNGTGNVTIQSLDNARSLPGQDVFLAEKDYNLQVFGGTIDLQFPISLYEFDAAMPGTPVQSFGLFSQGAIVGNSVALTGGQWVLSGNGGVGTDDTSVSFTNADVAIVNQGGDVFADFGANSSLTPIALGGTTYSGIQTTGSIEIEGANSLAMGAVALTADTGKIEVDPPLQIDGAVTMNAPVEIVLNGAISGAGSLTATSDGNVSLPAIGSITTPFGETVVTSTAGAIELDGDIFAGGGLTLASDDITIDEAIRLDTSANNGSLDLSGATIAGDGALTFDAGTGRVSLANIGTADDRFQSLTFEELSELELNGSIFLEGDFDAAANEVRLVGETIEIATDGNIDLSEATVSGESRFVLSGDRVQLGDFTTTDPSGAPATLTALEATAQSEATVGNVTATDDIRIVVTDGDLVAGDLSTDSTVFPRVDGGSIFIQSQTGAIQVGNLSSTGNNGGDISVLAELAITAGQIDSRGLAGDGGDVFLDPIGDIEVGFVNAEGSNTGSGGNITAITTGGFFRATETFTARDGSTASLSSAGGAGGGNISISHAGGDGEAPIAPFEIGNAGQNGTAGVVTTGSDRLESGESFPRSFSRGGISLSTDDGVDPTPVEPEPEPVEPEPVPIEPEPEPVEPEPIIPVEPEPEPLPVEPEPEPVEPDPIPVEPEPIPVEPPPEATPAEPANPGLDDTRSLTQSGRAVTDDRSGQTLTILDLDTAVASLERALTEEYLRYFATSSNERWEYRASGSEGRYSTQGGDFSILSLDEIRRQLLQTEEEIGTKTALIYITFGRRALGENAVLVCPTPDDFSTAERPFAPSCDRRPNDPIELLVVTGDGDPLRWRVEDADRETVERLIGNLLVSLTNPRQRRTDTYRAPAEELYRLLFAPIAPTLEAREIENLVFIPDARLRSMPVAALHSGDRFLIEDYSLAVMPSFSLTQPRYASLQNRPVLAMGASEFEAQPDLLAVPIELQSITDGGASGDIFLNEDFTRDNLSGQRRDTGYPIVHLATHADFLPGNPDESFIQLWDERLNMPAVEQLDWRDPRVQLLVLSACRTAVGNDEAELGFAGLSLQAGVSSALASLWYSNDLSTLALMDSFYNALDTAPIRAAALQRAQLSLLRGEVFAEGDRLTGLDGELPLSDALNFESRIEFSHPYYWAAFTAIGNPW